MKKLFLLLVLSFFSAQSLAGSCPDGSDPVRSISDDGTYFVFSCSDNNERSSSNTFEIQNPDRYCSSVILPNDVASIKKSNVCLNDKTAFKEYGLQVVDKKDGHPVRAGNKSMRFELRDGDCNNPPPPNWNDCKGDRERFEISGADMFDGEQGWHAWSIFLPSDFVDIMNPALLDLAQFSIETTKDSDPCCALLFKKTKNGFVLDSELQNRAWIPLGSPQEQMWSDFLVNYKWSKKDDGFIKLWLNNKLVYEYTGQTITKNTEYAYLKFGIYRGGLSRYLNHKNFTPEVETCFRNNGASNELINVTKKGEWSELLGLGADAPSFNIYKQCKHLYKIKMPTHIVYFDEVRAGKTKEEVVGNLPPRIKNTKESGSETSINKSIFVSNKDFNDFLNLPSENRINSCGYKSFSPNWRVINKDLAPRIKGYNSKMDNWRKVEGAYSRDVLVKYLEASTYAMVSDDEALKEKLFDKLYQWASKNALSATMQCYSNGPKGVLPACEGEWSDPDGQDIAPIKDATVAVETVMSLNYLYKLYYADYKPEDDKHKAILGWFESFYPRIKASKDFYFGNSAGWHFPNISIKHSLNKDYKSLIQNMVNGLDEWSFADGSMKERTTRGNRALWYHSNALGEAFIILEIARIAEVEIPPTLEKKLLKAAELFNDAFLDHSVIEP